MAPRSRRGVSLSREPAPPSPPASLELATVADHDLDVEASYEGLGFFDIDLSERSAESVMFSQCRFRTATLAGSTMNRVNFTDCLVETSDWANLSADGGALHRVRLAGVRMTGFTWLKGMVKDAYFEQCRGDLSSWRFSDFKTVIFRECNLTRADFSSCDLSGTRFVDCDLTEAFFDNARMAQTTFRGCTLVNIHGVTSWNGAIVQASDLSALSYTLAAALGIQITADE